MRKKIVKLVVAASLLAGSFGVGLAPRAASAAVSCPPLCCDPNCFGIRQCFWTSSGCICRVYCEPNLGGGTD
ncbi:MAG TPA: hypothetical protein VGM86_18470 [Thermoanaerobaculia bacterium]|jgi:hypothetical protein